MDACRDAVNLEHELRDAVPSADLEGTVGVIEQDHADVPAVVRVDDARAHVDVVLPGEAAARRDAPVRTPREDDGDVGTHERLPVRGHDGVVRGVEVVAGRAFRSAGRGTTVVPTVLAPDQVHAQDVVMGTVVGVAVRDGDGDGAVRSTYLGVYDYYVGYVGHVDEV
jgi:hypothetical protein